MEEIDKKKVLEKGNQLREEIENKIKAENAGKIEIDIKITVKYLGELGQTEGATKSVFRVEIEGEPLIKDYDEDGNLLGVKMQISPNVILSDTLSSKPAKEQERIKKFLETSEGKPLEELELEVEKENKPEEPVLPGLEDEQMQLTVEQVNRLLNPGPKISLVDNIVDGQTLGNRIGLRGTHILMADADEVKRYLPHLNIPLTQTTVPLEINSDGSANAIDGNILEYQGTVGNEDKTTITDRGKTEKRNAIDEFRIVATGAERETLTVERGKNGEMPQTVSYGREKENTQLESVHEGPIDQDSQTARHQADASKGIDKGKVPLDDAIKYAKAAGFYIFDVQGKKVGLDVLKAEEEILANGGTLEAALEGLEEKTKVPGPSESPRPH